MTPRYDEFGMALGIPPAVTIRSDEPTPPAPECADDEPDEPTPLYVEPVEPPDVVTKITGDIINGIVLHIPGGLSVPPDDEPRPHIVCEGAD